MISFEGEILILTGPPGSGKSTTGEALAQLPGSPKVHLHTDDFWGYIKSGLIAPWLPEAHAQNEVVTNIFANVAEGYAKAGYFVVLDGIVRPWLMPVFLAMSVPIHYIVLRPPLEVAIERCRTRGGDTLTDPGPIADLHKQFSFLAELESHVLLIDGLTEMEVLDKVILALESGSFRLAS